MLLISGEAGVGKSRLIAALVEEAAAMGRFVSVGQCPGEGAVLPLEPWRAALEGLGARPTGDLYDLAAEMAAMLAAGPPALLVLEEMHGADAASVDLIRHLAGRLEQSEALLLVTYRNTDLGRSHPLYHLLPSLLRGGAERLLLDRLTEAQVAELARRVGRPEAGAAVYTRSDGNPFFATELLMTEGDGIPEAVERAVEQRLRHLSPASLEILRVASIIGRSFDFDTLRASLESPEERVMEALEEAARLHLIGEEGERFRFGHALVREVLYAGFIGPRRRRWHARIAGLLKEPDQIAYHLGQAGDPRAVPHLLEAGNRAMRLGARSEALGHYRRALELATAQEPLRPELSLLTGAACFDSDPSQASAYLEEARLGAAESGDPVVQALARYLLAWLLSRQGVAQAVPTMDLAHRELEAVWREPRLAPLQELITGRAPRLPGGPDGLAHVYLWSGRPDAAEGLLRASLTESVSPPTEEGHWILGEAAWLRGDLTAAYRHYRRSAEEALERRRYQSAAYRLAALLEHWLAHRGTEQAEIDPIVTLLAEAWQLANRHGGAAPGEPWLALQFWRGNWAELRQEIDGFRRLNAAGRSPWAKHYQRWGARLDHAQGEPSGGLAPLAEALAPGGPGRKPRYGDYAPAMTEMTWLAGVCRLSGELASARAWLQTVDGWHAGPRPSLLNDGANQVEWAELCRAEGDAEGARQAARAALAMGKATGSTTGLLLPAHRILGGLGGEEAEAHWAAALELANQARAPYQTALVLLERGRHDDLYAARATLAGLGARPALERAERALAGLRSAFGRNPGGLTGRELEVARLVAQGLTDREVARRLFISPRTVDGHLRNIFTKLNLGSRAALVGWALRSGITRERPAD